MTSIILASASPRRSALLKRAGILHSVAAATIDETPLEGEEPHMCALRLARAKCDALTAKYPDQVVLAADTVVSLDGVIHDQPSDAVEARTTLRALSGATHVVHTAVVIGWDSRAGGQAWFSRVEPTRVTFRRLSEETIEWYVATGEPLGKAGAYAIQGLGMALVSRVEGSFSNVMGLPMPETTRWLESALYQFEHRDTWDDYEDWLARDR